MKVAGWSVVGLTVAFAPGHAAQSDLVDLKHAMMEVAYRGDLDRLEAIAFGLTAPEELPHSSFRCPPRPSPFPSPRQRVNFYTNLGTLPGAAPAAATPCYAAPLRDARHSIASFRPDAAQSRKYRLMRVW